jgi:hypothetical protein
LAKRCQRRIFFRNQELSVLPQAILVSNW